jgi:deoxyribonuclease V
MQLPKPIHAWQVSTQEAILIQKQVAKMLEIIPLLKPPRFIAGLDAAFSPDGQECIAAVVIWDMQAKCVVEQVTAMRPVYFPYIPGFLTFREAPALLAALEKIKKIPDVLMCDGQGIAHPRGLGIAAHLGVFTQMPAFGCGKSRLVGSHDMPDIKRGVKTPLTYKGKIIGSVLRTKDKTKPVYISVGHKIVQAEAEKITLECFNGYRLPEPTRLADKLVAAVKRQLATSE